MKDNRAKLRLTMARTGLKSKDVAALIHRNESTVRRYMCGLTRISDELLEALIIKIGEKKEEVAA